MITPTTIDAILVVIVLEAIGLSWWVRRSDRTQLIGPLLLFLASGAALMMALRAALNEASETMMSILLLVAGLLHVACLWCFRQR